MVKNGIDANNNYKYKDKFICAYFQSQSQSQSQNMDRTFQHTKRYFFAKHIEKKKRKFKIFI